MKKGQQLVFLICFLAIDASFQQVPQERQRISLSRRILPISNSNSSHLRQQITVTVQDLQLKDIEDKRTLQLSKASTTHLENEAQITQEYTQEIAKVSSSSGSYSPPSPYTKEEVSALFSIIWRNSEFEQLKLNRVKDLTELIAWKNEQIMNIRTNSLIPICDSLIKIFREKNASTKSLHPENSQINELQDIKGQSPNFTFQSKYYLYMLILNQYGVIEKEINDKFVKDSEKFRGIYDSDFEKYLDNWGKGLTTFSISEHLRLLTLRRDTRTALATQEYKSKVAKIEENYQKEVNQWHTESAQSLLDIHQQGRRR